MKKQQTVSVFKKLYLLFIIIIAIIYACTIIIFVAYANQQKNEEIETMRATVEQGAGTLHRQLDIVSNLEGNLVSDSRTTTIFRDINLDSYERVQLMSGLIENMRGYQSMNNIVENIAVLFPGQEMELSVLNELTRKACYPSERVEGDTARNLVYLDNQVCMELWYPLTRSIVENYQPDYGVRVTLSEEYLRGLLELFTNEEQVGAFYAINTKEGLLQFPAGTDSDLQFMVSWQQAWDKAGQEDSFMGRALCQRKRYLFLSESIPEYGITMVVYRNGRWIENSTVKALLVMGGVIILVSAMFLMMLYQTDKIVNKPLQKVVQAFEKVQAGDLTIRISHIYQDEFQYIYSAFNEMVERISELIENVKEQGRLLQNAELIQLQSQINPHFLYNSFYLIRIMANNESYEQITQFVTSLAKYYRFLNKEMDLNIPLSREAEHMENYIDIQQMRFGDKITVEVGRLPESITNFRVPKLILQPVVENAYNYGMADILQDGQIIVNYEIREDFLYISVEDNGSGADVKNIEQMREFVNDYQGRAAGHALSNIDRRLKLAYGENSGILLEKSALGGLKVILKLDITVHL